MITQAGDTLTLHFALSALNGSELDSTFGAEPITLRLGSFELDGNLEKCLIGLETGQRYEFTLEPEQAFGPGDPALIRPISKAMFGDRVPAPGNLMEFTQPDGENLAGIVREIGEEQVTVDFNHPLSGCVVRFEVEILEIAR
ncbi:MAG: FKBP-type peptidyl-prolyl cis-trans isomerase [Sulfuricellaceae bacterium]